MYPVTSPVGLCFNLSRYVPGARVIVPAYAPRPLVTTSATSRHGLWETWTVTGEFASPGNAPLNDTVSFVTDEANVTRRSP